jgi:ABC-type multidrug transport system ATPase subunit
MSEEILKALMQLFAIISKQDDGSTDNQREFVRSFLSSQVNSQKVQEYLNLYDEKAGTNDQAEQSENKLTSVKDSVRTLAICRKINKTLTHKQKIVVLLRLFEMLMSEQLFTEQRMSIIRTVAIVFNVVNEELELIDNFIRSEDPCLANSNEILMIGTPVDNVKYRFGCISSQGLDKNIFILRIKSADLYFIKYSGVIEIFLNGLSFNTRKISIFPYGSTLRIPKGTVYYNDVVSRFLCAGNTHELSFKAENIVYTFQNKAVGLRDINISEKFGLVGIMGASGSGKTTLLNVLSGIEKPDSGSVRINGLDIHKEDEEARNLIGYIAQDDFLMEDLTVFDNLYFNAKLCFSQKTDEEITDLVDKTLADLNLTYIRDIKVGNPLNKKISGGQRKRLNIALELIREPSVLFVDEPTSGLSSRDSENVMDLLKELSLRMKLIFVVIHQPSSDIFKMFDKLYIVDTGGYPIYYGNPIEALIYFKHASDQINAENGECHSCGNVNPELLFSIIESKEVDDFGRFTPNRIKTPAEWNELFKVKTHVPDIEEVNVMPPRLFRIPDRLRQTGIFIKRDILSKTSNLQYMLISLLEAPLMALFLTAIIKYFPGRNARYIFRENDNILPYIFMSIIISLFIGLSISAEEIFRDRKILKRERFLNLSRSGYLMSKIVILFTLSAVQMLLFVLIGNSILGIHGMSFNYWLVLFTVSCFSNILGLNISSAFNSAVTIYILIPLLVIPQMALGGAMFSFDKINKLFCDGDGKAPVVADFMASRWAYEALAVNQFMDNRYERNFYTLEQIESNANYRQAYYFPELNKVLDETIKLSETGNPDAAIRLEENLNLLRNEIKSESALIRDFEGMNVELLTTKNFNRDVADQARNTIRRLEDKYKYIFNSVNDKKDQLTVMLEKKYNSREEYLAFYDSYNNDFLSDVVRKTTAKNKIIREKDKLIRIYEPVFNIPDKKPVVSLRAHFFTPVKFIFGMQVNTFIFNIIIIWLMTLLFSVALYYDLLRRIVEAGSKKRISNSVA